MIVIKEKKSLKIPGDTSLYVSFDYNIDYINIIKNYTDLYVYNKSSKEWEVAVTDLHRLIEAFHELDDITLKLLKDKEQKNTVQKEAITSNFKSTPFPYQIEAIEYGLNHNKSLNLSVMGLGKTLEAIYIAEELYNQKKIKHCLVICGIASLRTNWKKEIARHSKLDAIILGETVSSTGKVSYASVPSRIKQLRGKIKEFFVITNAETIRNTEFVDAFNHSKTQFDMIIVDEIHTFVNRSAQQSKHLLKLNAEYKLGLTGTPIINNPINAYVPLTWIGRNRSTLTSFKKYFCTFGGFGNFQVVGYKNLDILKDMLSDCSIRHTTDLLDLPKKNIIDEFVDMNTKHREFYDNIVKGLFDQVDKVHLSSTMLLSLVTRLRQATACPSVLSSDIIDPSKISRAVELVHDIFESNDTATKIVIFSTFKETTKILAERLGEYNPLVCTGDNSEAEISASIDLFQADNDHKIMIATWQKMGTGITLTAANYCIYIDTPWTAASKDQSDARIYRISQTKPVFIYNLICSNSIDERVLEIVNDKSALANYIVDNDIPTPMALESLRKYIENL